MTKQSISPKKVLTLLLTILLSTLINACGLTIAIHPDSKNNDPLQINAICEKGPKELVQETGLALSGGGYRAMLFHLGSVWRLYEAGILAKCDRITSVSGGSITAAVLGLAWEDLQVNTPDEAIFIENVVTPIRKLSSKTIDRPSILKGIFSPGNINSKVEKYYKKYLYQEKTLQDLPDSPRFIIMATNIQTASAFRFSKEYLADYRLGIMLKPETPLSIAVGASSAFPPFLSPTIIKFNDGQIHPCTGSYLNKPENNYEYTKKIELTDGGVYDNMGLEPIDNYSTILISDGGGKTQPEFKPLHGWVKHSVRVLELIDNQVRSLRKRMTFDGTCYPEKECHYRNREECAKTVAYWSTRTILESDQLKCTPHMTDLTPEFQKELSKVETRLKSLDDNIQEGLINWGYISCDAILRTYYDEDLPIPESIPYPVTKKEE
jgi:NTE family protein